VIARFGRIDGVIVHPMPPMRIRYRNSAAKRGRSDRPAPPQGAEYPCGIEIARSASCRKHRYRHTPAIARLGVEHHLLRFDQRTHPLFGYRTHCGSNITGLVGGGKNVHVGLNCLSAKKIDRARCSADALDAISRDAGKPNAEVVKKVQNSRPSARSDMHALTAVRSILGESHCRGPVRCQSNQISQGVAGHEESTGLSRAAIRWLCNPISATTF
jgi:hypothetical protein